MKALEDYTRPQLLKVSDFNSAAFAARCEEIADVLLNSSLLIVGNENYRIREVEFYGFSEEHQDVYSHQHPQQKSFGDWHFHRMGSKKDAPFRMGTRKGLDLTLGDEVRYLGVLLRSIEGVEGRIDGSCLLVNRILKHYRVHEVKELPQDGSVKLELHHSDALEKVEFVKAPRVGLYAKTKEPWIDYVDHMYNPLRFIAEPHKTHKDRELLFLYQAYTVGEKRALEILGLDPKTGARWLEFAHSGKGKDLPTLLSENFKTREGRCRTYGAYWAHSMEKSSKK